MRGFLLSFVMMSLFGSVGFADGTVPNCWGQPSRFVEGHYLVATSTEGTSARDALKLLKNNKVLKIVQTDTVGDIFFVFLETKRSVTSKNKANLQTACEEELVTLTKLDGVTVSCSSVRRAF